MGLFFIVWAVVAIIAGLLIGRLVKVSNAADDLRREVLAEQRHRDFWKERALAAETKTTPRLPNGRFGKRS